ncbi:MAG: hypothetical protein HZA51_11920 [Planctomycetes bacterium]|nr:hypothetical protein [Planctomycetota bacterium]
MLKLVRTTAFFSALALSFISSAEADLVDFEGYAGFGNIHGQDLGGVTLFNNNTGYVIVYDDAFGLGSHSGTKCMTDPSFGRFNKIVGVFDNPQSHVSLWGGLGVDYGQILGWSLEVFDASVGGNSLAISMQGTWVGTPYTYLEVNAPGIKRFEAVLAYESYSGICFDDLVFTPEPSSMLLVVCGSLGFLGRKARVRRALRNAA